MRALRNFRTNRCYHLISRIANRAFFLTEEERTRFVDRLWRVAAFSGVEVLATDGRPRAYEYRVRALSADGTKLVETKVHSPFINCPESQEPDSSVCAIEKTAALSGKGVRFTVEPLDCWGNAGRAITTKGEMS